MHTTKTDRKSGQITSQALVGDPNRPTLTSIIQRELDDFGQQRQRRSRVVGRLIFLQAALLAMGAPLNFWPNFQPIAIVISLLGLAFFGFAWVRNISGHVPQARWLLIVGSGVITAANMIGQVVWQPGHILPVGLASFPFLLTIFEAGLLFYPEIVLLTTAATAAFTALIFLVTLLVGSELRAEDTYLLAVMTLGLQALSGIIAWQVAHFILDYSTELAQARREEFIVTQFDALRRTMDEQAARLREQVVLVVHTILALTNRNYTARAGILEGELKPIADALNVLSGQLSAIAANEHAHLSTASSALHAMEVLGQMAEGSASSSGSANSSLTPTIPANYAMQNLVNSLQTTRDAMQQRLGLVRDLATEAGQRLVQVEEHSRTTSRFVGENMATIGLLRAEAERVHTSSTQLNELIDQTLNELSALLPPEVSAFKRSEARETQPVPIMPGVTIQFEALSDDTELDFGKANSPYTPPVEAVALNQGLDPNAQAKLRDAWSRIVSMTEKVAMQLRDTDDLQDKLGLTSRTMRQVDTDLIQMRNAVAGIRQLAEQLYHTSNVAKIPLAVPLPDSVEAIPPQADVARPATQDTPGSLNASDLIDTNFNQGQPQGFQASPSRPVGDVQH